MIETIEQSILIRYALFEPCQRRFRRAVRVQNVLQRRLQREQRLGAELRKVERQLLDRFERQFLLTSHCVVLLCRRCVSRRRLFIGKLFQMLQKLFVVHRMSLLFLLCVLLLLSVDYAQSLCADESCESDFDDVKIDEENTNRKDEQQQQPPSIQPPPEYPENHFFTLDMHWNMINDYVRNNAYEAAINEVVNSESVVIDLGTGTGLLALMAARAGAKRVYAIERNPITAEVARQIIALNDKRGVVRLLRARSQDVRFDASCTEETENCIPLKANVLISETLATDINGEFWMGALFDARRRGLLTNDCIIVPSSAVVYGQVVWSSYGMPVDYRLNGFDLTPLAAHRSSAIRGVEISTTYTLNFTEPIELVTYDYQRYTEPEPAGGVAWPGTLRTATALRDGTLNGVAVWWLAQLSPSVRLSTQQGIRSCWAQNVIVQPLDHVVQRGDEIDVGTIHNGHITFTAVQPRRLREHRAWLRIQSWSPLSLDVWWEEPSSKVWLHRGTIPANDVQTNNIGDNIGQHQELCSPGHRFGLKKAGETEFIHIVTVTAGVLNQLMVSRENVFTFLTTSE